MHRWRSFSDAERIVAIFGMSLDEVLELMSKQHDVKPESVIPSSHLSTRPG